MFKFFGKVSSTKKINKGGMGFGLTISKMIVQQLNGEIRVESELQKGSCFTFEIAFESDSL